MLHYSRLLNLKKKKKTKILNSKGVNKYTHRISCLCILKQRAQGDRTKMYTEVITGHLDFAYKSSGPLQGW